MRGAPVSPREPPATSTWPEENLVEAAPRRGSRRRTAGAIRPMSASSGPPRGDADVEHLDLARMSLARMDPQAGLGRVERDGRRARTAAPATTPVEASTPEGTSTLTTGAEQPSIAAIASPTAPRGSPAKPVPSRASTTHARPGERVHAPSELQRSLAGQSLEVRQRIPASASPASRRTRPSPAGPRRAAGARRRAHRRRCCPCRTPRPPARRERAARPRARRPRRRAPSDRARARRARRSPSGRSPACARRRAAAWSQSGSESTPRDARWSHRLESERSAVRWPSQARTQGAWRTTYASD